MRIALALVVLVASSCRSPEIVPTTDGATGDLASRPDGASVGVQCGSSFCDTSTGALCCETFPPTCGAGPCSSGIQAVACDGPEDCPGAVCCLFVSPMFGSFCAMSCDNGGKQRGVICHTRADCSAGEVCCPLEVSGGLSGCVQGTPNPSCT
jgi:hypothetical protein